MITFHDGLAWVAQLTMFLTLGLLVFPSRAGRRGAAGGTRWRWCSCSSRVRWPPWWRRRYRGFGAGERLVLGWAGLRGAVPVVLATFPVIEGVPGSREFFNIVFFAVLLSTLLQGTTFEALARAAGRHRDEAALPAAARSTSATARSPGAEIVEHVVSRMTPRPARACASSACRATRCLD